MNSGTGAILETVERVSSPIAVCDAELTDDLLRSAWDFENRKGRNNSIACIILYAVLTAFSIVLFISSVSFALEHRYLLTALLFSHLILVYLLVCNILNITIYRKKRIDGFINVYRFSHGQRLHIEFDERAVTEVYKHGEETFELTTLIDAVQVKDFWVLHMGSDKNNIVNFVFVPVSGFATEYEYSFFLDKIVGTANQNQA